MSEIIWTLIQCLAIAVVSSWLILFMMFLGGSGGYDEGQETPIGWFLKAHLKPFKWVLKKLKPKRESEAGHEA